MSELPRVWSAEGLHNILNAAERIKLTRRSERKVNMKNSKKRLSGKRGRSAARRDILKWERRHSADLQNTINRLRDAMVKVGLVLSWTEPPNPKLTDCIIIISKALKQPKNRM